jgi:hypothetical protein
VVITDFRHRVICITQTLHLGAHLDGSWRSDGIGSAAAKVTVSGAF